MQGKEKIILTIKLSGAVLFSIGLIPVIIENCSLYTGKIGFNCIANVFYLSVSKIISFKAIGFIITCIIGNTTGSLIATVLQNVVRKDCNEI